MQAAATNMSPTSFSTWMATSPACSFHRMPSAARPLVSFSARTRRFLVKSDSSMSRFFSATVRSH